MRSLILLVVVAVTAACAPRTPPAESAGPNGSDAAASYTGVMRVVGSAPLNDRPVLVAEDGTQLRVTGPLMAEMRSVAGAVLEAHGHMDRGNLVVERYRIVSVNGRPVYVGTVEESPGGGLRLRLEDGSYLGLDAPSGQFQAGQRIWVQGPQRVRVQSYGMIDG